MDYEKPSSSSINLPLPLFPAYSSEIQNQEVKKDWLCNSSFAEATLEEVHSQLAHRPDSETPPLENATSAPPETSSAKVKLKEKKRPHKRKKYEEYLQSFSIPESESILCQLKKATFIEQTGLSLERAYLTDKVRDPDNLMYECLEKTKIAKHKLLFQTPVGLSAKELSLWALTLPKNTDKIVRYFSKAFLKKLKTDSIETIRITKEPLQNVSLNYIPISTPSSNSSEKYEQFPNFIDVSTSWKQEKKSDKTLTTKDCDSEIYNADELRNEIVNYNKKLSENLENIEMWLDFVDFQDKIFLSENTDKYMYSERSLTEKKIAILEKALKNNPKDVRLSTLRLKLGQNLFEPSKLSAMWEELVFFNPNKPEVWQEYLLHGVSNLMSFNVSNIMKLYGKCLRTLCNICEGVTQSHKPSHDTVHNMLGIFYQLCYILRNCGYTEKAIALFQALVEFNLFCESSTNVLSIEEKIACFEPFWDSGALRIGEEKALGWATTIQQKKIELAQLSTDSDLNNMEDDILSKKLSTAETWLEFEKLREKHHWLPWRPNPEFDQTSDDVDDIDRTVPFDDISKFMFNVKEEEQMFLLILHFLTFFGFDLHFMGCHNMNSKISCNPYHLENYENILNRAKGMIHTSMNPFPSDNYWSEDRYNFVKNVFSQVDNKFSSKYRTLLTFLRIKFEKYYSLYVNSENNGPKDLKKFIKGILKKTENRNCLLLWFEYIQSEFSSDKSSAAKTFQMLLQSSISAISQGNNQLLGELWYFCQAWIELNLVDENEKTSLATNEILWLLMHIASKEKYVPYSGQEIKPTFILKTVAAFKSDLEKELNVLDAKQTSLCYCLDPCTYSVLNCAKCLAYFQYFSQGCDAAMQVYETVISSVNSRDIGRWEGYILEQLDIAQAKILNYHTWNSTSSIKPLQAFLQDSVTKYPHNSQLLYMLIKQKGASSVISPTRRFLAQILRRKHRSDPLTWFFALLAEFSVCRSVIFQNDFKEEFLRETVSNLGINWRIRSLFEKMLQSNACDHICILWRAYLSFELLTQNTEKAKSVCYRALQNCGWSKELLIDVIKNFPEKLEEMLALMSEKQIRIHTPLEEVALLMEHTRC